MPTDEAPNEPMVETSEPAKKIDRRSLTSAQNGRNSPNTGHLPSPIDLEIATNAAAIAIVEDQGRSKLAESTGLSDSDTRKIIAITGLTPPEFNERVAAKIDELLDGYADRLLRDKDKVPLTHVSISFGILNEHRMRLRGLATPAASHVTNIQINGVDRGSALALLSPSSARSVSSITPALQRVS